MQNEKLIKRILNFLSNRLLILLIGFAVMFYLIVIQLFNIQILGEGSYDAVLASPSFREITLTAQRGTIYDRYGRPLAVNEVTMILKIDPAAIEKSGDVNRTVYELIKLLERNEEEYSDDFPISINKPYTFLLNESESRERKWKKDMDLPEDLTAEECVVRLRRTFDIDEEIPALDARKIIGLRSEIYMRRYRKEEHITVAFGIKEATLVAIEENNDIFPGVYADYDFLRHYPEGLYMSNIVGYIRGLTEESELEAFGEGYSYGMLVGKTGIELSFEKELAGKKGSKLIEVSNSGRELRSIPLTEPEQGNKIFLTIDSALQRKCYEMLEDTLKDTLINKIRGVASPREDPITMQQFFAGLLKGTAISVNDIYDAEDDSLYVRVRDYLWQKIPDLDTSLSADAAQIRAALIDAINDDQITPQQMTSVLYEQGYITGDDAYIARFLRGGISTVDIIVNCLENKTITPQMTGLDPCTGSVVVVDVKTGDVLAAAGYPSYDTNMYVNTLNVDYFLKQQNDPTRPQLNRPFTEPRAPGSTFKMLTAIAGLETGTINTRSTYYDAFSWEKAGEPFTECWSPVSHGHINVTTALEVSCNYFFCEMSFAMAGGGREYESIRALNRYMMDFGFNAPTGVEIIERNQGLEDGQLVISSPEYKEALMLARNKNTPARDYTWYAGDTVRTSIGQSENNYTTANMAKYIATLAAGGTRYKFSLIDKTETHMGELVKNHEPVIETVVDIRQETLDAVYGGMLAVTSGSKGTAANVFRGFPIKVAGKTGTAEEISNRSDHSSFGGFAPYEDPQVAVYVMLPFGSTQALPHASAVLTRKVFEEYFGLDTEPDRPGAVNILSR